MRAIVTVGLPGCGKSTYAARLLAGDGLNARGIIELNLDALRAEISGDASNQAVTGVAIALRNRRLNSAALAGHDVIISDTHARRRHRNRLLRILRKLGFETEIVFFNVGIATCKQRNAKRGRQVPEHAIEAMARFLTEHPPGPQDANAFVVVHDAVDPLLPRGGLPVCPPET